MKPTYFDLTVSDIGQARAFFEATLGWRFEKFDMPYEYYRINAGAESEPGIDGGIGAVKDTPLSEGRPMTQVTVPVANLNEVVARVVAHGGSIVEPRIPIPGIGWYATCAEPGGLKFGLIEADPAAKRRAVTPNPSLEPTRTGMALGPLPGVVHHPSSGPSATPALAAQLKR